MICSNCGSENRPDTRFCYHCGAALVVAAVEVTPVEAGATASPAGSQMSSPGYTQPPPVPAPQPSPGAWQTGPQPQPTQFTAPKAPGWLAHFTQQLAAGGPAFHGITRPLEAATAPLAPAGKLVVAAVGSVLLVLGSFLPAQSVVGFSWNFWYFFKFTALFLLVLAVVNVLAALTELYTWQWIASGLALLLVLLAFLDVLLGPVYSLSWGWFIMLLGVIVMIAAAAMPASRPSWMAG